MFHAAQETNAEIAGSFRLFQRDLSEIPGVAVDIDGPFVAVNPAAITVLKAMKDANSEILPSSGGGTQDEFASEEISARSKDLTVTEAKILSLIEHRGIAKYSDIEEAYCRAGFGSPGSVIPIMSTSNAFKRYAPGWWGKAGLELTEQDIGKLCNDADLRAYISAKRGGAILEMFPFWTPYMEYRWLRWTEHGSVPKIFESLLAVSNPENWPVSAAIKAQWIQKKKLRGFYQLPAPGVDFETGLTEFSDYYGLIHLACDRGSMGYAAIPQFLGWGFVNDRRGLSAIAVLVALGVLEQGASVDTLHKKGSRAEEWLNRCSIRYLENPSRAKSEWFECLKDELFKLPVNGKYGWFSVRDIQLALPGWKQSNNSHNERP